MGKHTLAPLVQRGCGIYSRDLPGKRIARVEGGTFGADDEAHAYARLFAAAPAMAQSLRALLEQITSTSAWEDAKRGEDPAMVDAVEGARAALAEAEGV